LRAGSWPFCISRRAVNGHTFRRSLITLIESARTNYLLNEFVDYWIFEKVTLWGFEGLIKPSFGVRLTNPIPLDWEARPVGSRLVSLL
jgi:hypothetical protein